MKNWSRRVGAAIANGFLWAAAWFGAGILVARVPGFFSDLPFALLFAPFGFVTGILFHAVLVAVEGRPGFDRVSLSRVAVWGAITGLLVSGIFVVLRGEWREFLAFGPSLAPASAVAAAGSLAMARSAEKREPGRIAR